MGNFGKMAVMFGLGAIVGAALNAASMQDSCAACKLLPEEKKEDEEEVVKPFSFKHQAVGNAKITEKVTDYIKKHYKQEQAFKCTPAETKDEVKEETTGDQDKNKYWFDEDKLKEASLDEVAEKMKNWGFTKEKVNFIYEYMKKSNINIHDLFDVLDRVCQIDNPNGVRIDDTMTADRAAQMSTKDPRTTVE